MTNDTHLYDLCKEHMHAYVLAEMQDGSKMDGIITGLDDEYVYFAVPNDYEQNVETPYYQYPTMDQRQFGYHGYPGYGPGYGHGGYGYGGYGHGYGHPPGNRFQRVVLPLAALTAISLLPWY